jgi:hypothetical protein
MNPELAVRAHKSGLYGAALARELGTSVAEANSLASVGARIAEIAATRLTPSEILLLRSIATVTRGLLANGSFRGAKSWEIASAACKGRGWPVATARKRLHEALDWDPKARLHRRVGLGLVVVSGNGYVNLTNLGWAFVQAIEAAERSVGGNP